jgi:ferredoxin/flavodoxin---NADP+ reductase
MSRVGAETSLRVAIVGSGPAGFYTAESLLGREGVNAQVDMFERLPAPYGLVRYGVAPDHEKIKSVTRVFDKKTASKPTYRFFGNVDIGKDITLSDLCARYHMVCFASGAQTDRRMGIPGEDLAGSYAATEFVAWYNGHPEYRDCEFHLDKAKRVAVVGVGNVAVDVARMLCRTPDELGKTDIADYALDAMAKSTVEEVVMLGRRGPTQAAFTNPEVRELGQLDGADVHVESDEVQLDDLSKAELQANPDRTTQKKVEILQGFAEQKGSGKPMRLTIRFLTSPVELQGDDDGHVRGLKLVRNELYTADGGSLRPRATDTHEVIPVDIVFRSVGYRGVPIDGIPFRDDWGIVPNDHGRVIDPDADGAPVTGVYVSGWIKRGPSGVIGTNKPDAVETVNSMVADLEAGALLQPTDPDPESLTEFVRTRQPGMLTFGDWERLAELEQERGAPNGRPRVKFTSRDEALSALGR